MNEGLINQEHLDTIVAEAHQIVAAFSQSQPKLRRSHETPLQGAKLLDR